MAPDSTAPVTSAFSCDLEWMAWPSAGASVHTQPARGEEAIEDLGGCAHIWYCMLCRAASRGASAAGCGAAELRATVALSSLTCLSSCLFLSWSERLSDSSFDNRCSIAVSCPSLMNVPVAPSGTAPAGATWAGVRGATSRAGSGAAGARDGSSAGAAFRPGTDFATFCFGMVPPPRAWLTVARPTSSWA